MKSKVNLLKVNLFPFFKDTKYDDAASFRKQQQNLC